jgi:hypothetical protein
MLDTFFDDLYEELEELVSDGPIPREFYRFKKTDLPEAWGTFQYNFQKAILQKKLTDIYGSFTQKFYFWEADDEDAIVVGID